MKIHKVVKAMLILKLLADVGKCSLHATAILGRHEVARDHKILVGFIESDWEEVEPGRSKSLKARTQRIPIQDQVLCFLYLWLNTDE